MTKFEKAIDVILRHEGGYVNDPMDPGGATNFGISYRWASKNIPECESVEYIKNMSKQQASEIYLVYWWNKNKYDNITDQLTATKIFDMAVNMGYKQAILLVQRAVCDMGTPIACDGILGKQTIDAINKLDQVFLISKIIGRQANFYVSLANEKPALKKFLSGWLHRAAWPLGESNA